MTPITNNLYIIIDNLINETIQIQLLQLHVNMFICYNQT